MTQRYPFSALALAFFLPLLISASGQAGLMKGQSAPNTCWNTIDNKPFCLDDAKGTVRVLIHNAGWCGPCNEEMSSLVPKMPQWKDKAVTFVSLSVAGWTKGSFPDTKYLTQWRDKHKIPFLLAASPKDAGKIYFDPPIFIPNIVVIDKNGKVFFKDTNPPLEKLFSEINLALEQ